MTDGVRSSNFDCYSSRSEPTPAHTSNLIEQAGVESNHDLPARTMPFEDHSTQRQDDPATMAASEELKHTTISDKISSNIDDEVHPHPCEPVEAYKQMSETAKATTPEYAVDVHDEDMKDNVLSPKKKRGRDLDDDEAVRHQRDDLENELGFSGDGSIVNANRTTRLEPEKKRPRDTSEDLSSASEKKGNVQLHTISADSSKSSDSVAEPQPQDQKSSPVSSTEPAPEDQPQTSKSAFAKSGFASLASSSTSPFGSLGAKKPSVFGGDKSSISGFGILASHQSSKLGTTTTLSGLGGLSSEKPSAGFGSSSAASPFGALTSGGVFGSKFGNGFGGGAGPKLSSFAAPSTDIKPLGPKPVKAFGAPESDEEECSGDDGSDREETDEEHINSGLEEKKRSKPVKVHIDDGEAGEATLLQIRAKIFALESKELGWKERGVGTLKINVPKSCINYDENLQLIPGTFNASGLEAEDTNSSGPRAARLIMRQENTHRVILNTIIVRAMEFKEKPSASTAQIMFTALEGEKELKPVSVLLKMSEANAKSFKAEIDSIQHEL